MTILRKCRFLLFSVASLFVLLPPFSQNHLSLLAQSKFQTLIDDKGTEMILIPAAEFHAGATVDKALNYCKTLYPDDSDTCSLESFNEFHLVDEPSSITLSTFYIDKYEVAVGSYLECVKSDVCDLQPIEQQYYSLIDDLKVETDLPVSGITYYDAAIYCAWRGARLPNEAEWEYAAAGSENVSFSWGNDTTQIPANYCDESCSRVKNPVSNDGFSELAPVTAYEDGKSWAGVYNLSGNVSEWTSTRLLTGDGAGNDIRIVKGGNYGSGLQELVVWMRVPTGASIARNNGFRCAKEDFAN
jgi:formylglycine-generating enzyme required for sulfatase activity